MKNELIESDGEKSVEVGIPDVSVLTQKSTTTKNPSTATLAAQSEFMTDETLMKKSEAQY